MIRRFSLRLYLGSLYILFRRCHFRVLFIHERILARVGIPCRDGDVKNDRHFLSHHVGYGSPPIHSWVPWVAGGFQASRGGFTDCLLTKKSGVIEDWIKKLGVLAAASLPAGPCFPGYLLGLGSWL